MIVIAGCSWANVTLAQDPAPGAAPGGTSAPATPDSTTGTDAATTTKPGNAFRTGESTRGTGTGRKSAFAYDSGDTDTSRPKARKKTDQTADAEQEKTGTQSAREEGTDSQFVVPSLYGRAPLVVTPGKGQYARPKFRYGISVGIGYDDNPDQTSASTTVATTRSRSGFTWVNGHWDAQWLKPRTAFTLNVEAGADFYWDRPGNSSDVNARIGLLYVNKIDPRTQFSATGSFAYLSQPDYSNIYSPTNQSSGDYFSASTKFDLSYRWAPHFSTITSASVNLLDYVNESTTTASNSYWSFIFGNEFRFQSSARLTWVVEGRYQLDEYISNKSLNAQTAYVLGGLDWIASRRLTTTLRTGASFRSYDIGGNSSAPYAEFSVNYLAGRHSTLSFNGRYGFEQATNPGDENLSYRLGLSYQQAFTSRLSGSVGANFIHTDYEARSGAKSTSDIYDFNAGLQYRLDRHFTLGLKYNYTLEDTSTASGNYDRNRILFSAQYEY
jgi:hypothetical protein